MNTEYVNKIRKAVKKELTKDRYHHTLGVSYTAASLAMRYDADMEQAFIAGLLHDCAKCIPDDIKLMECRKYGIDITVVELENPYLLHSKLGAYYLKSKYDIDDPQIEKAVLYHTTGNANMSILEKIIFVSDYIEPYRDKAPELDEIRKLAFENIDAAVYKITKDTLDYLNSNNNPVDETTKIAYDYYKKLIESNK